MEIIYWMKEMKNFDVLETKMLIDCKKKLINKACIIQWWIESNLSLITTIIWFWNKRDENHMLNEKYKEV